MFTHSFALLVMSAFAPIAADEPAVQKELERLAGTWKMESFTADGMEIKPEKKAFFVFSKDQVELRVDRVGEPVQKAKFRLNVTKNPKIIQIAGDLAKGEPEWIQGLFEIDGDELKIKLQSVSELTGKDQKTGKVVDRKAKVGPPPTAFDDKNGELLIFKRVKK